MTIRIHLVAFALSFAAIWAGPVLAQAARPGQQPAREAPARPGADVPAHTASISGRVVAADSGRPVRRARVLLNGPQIPGGRGTLTDNEGRFTLSALPAGRYSLSAARTGFITIAYGQRRPMQSGTPIEIAAGEQMTTLDIRMPRGSVITGRVFDESGEPLPGAMVRVLQYEYAQGNRRLAPVGGGQTDDLGTYRVWGLNPGQYFVSAAIPNAGLGTRMAMANRAAGSESEAEQVGYAPTYYPGVPSIGEARPVNVALSAEVTSVDFSVLLVPTARVAGRVRNPDGSDTTAGQVTLVPETGPVGRGGNGMTFGSRIDWDGSFAMVNVPAGRYLLRARSDDSVEPQFALLPVTVAGGDLLDLSVILAAAATITGTVTFQGVQQPDPGQFRIAAPLVDSGAAAGQNPTGRVERDGRFTISGLQAGLHLLRAQGNARGWVLKSATVDGRDAADAPFEVRSGQKLDGVHIVFGDRMTEINGTIADNRGVPLTDYTLLAFPVDESLWRPMSRYIITTRPDQNGKFQLRGLPAGDYYVAPIDPLQQGEWYEPTFLDAHRAAAARVSLAEGDVKTQDFTLRTQ